MDDDVEGTMPPLTTTTTSTVKLQRVELIDNPSERINLDKKTNDGRDGGDDHDNTNYDDLLEKMREHRHSDTFEPVDKVLHPQHGMDHYIKDLQSRLSEEKNKYAKLKSVKEILDYTRTPPPLPPPPSIVQSSESPQHSEQTSSSKKYEVLEHIYYFIRERMIQMKIVYDIIDEIKNQMQTFGNGSHEIDIMRFLFKVPAQKCIDTLNSVLGSKSSFTDETFANIISSMYSVTRPDIIHHHNSTKMASKKTLINNEDNRKEEWCFVIDLFQNITPISDDCETDVEDPIIDMTEKMDVFPSYDEINLQIQDPTLKISVAQYEFVKNAVGVKKAQQVSKRKLETQKTRVNKKSLWDLSYDRTNTPKIGHFGYCGVVTSVVHEITKAYNIVRSLIVPPSPIHPRVSVMEIFSNEMVRKNFILLVATEYKINDTQNSYAQIHYHKKATEIKNSIINDFFPNVHIVVPSNTDPKMKRKLQYLERSTSTKQQTYPFNSKQ